jgi:sortase (surface protein transpeptidase)
LSLRLHVPARRVGELALTAVLLMMLALAWSDGTPDGVLAGDLAGQAGRPPAFVPAPSVDFRSMTASVVGVMHITVPRPAPPVPKAAPAMILIPSLDVHRPIEPVGVDGSGTMYQPQNLWNAGWYENGPTAGAPGDAVIEGHAGYPDKPLLFGKLKSLVYGSQIVIVLADGSRRLFLVRSVSVWPAGTAPAGMGQPYGVPRLTLITCTGQFDKHYKTYADRLVVEAAYAGLA